MYRVGYKNRIIFTALHCMHAVFPIAKPSVRLSVTRVNCDKTNEGSANILRVYERSTRRMVGRDVPLYLKFWAKLASAASKAAIFNRY